MIANEKLAIPDKAKTDKHFQYFSDLFKDEIASAKTPPLKARLATLIFDDYTKDTSSTDQLYAILMFSYGLARESGEKPITDKIRGELDSVFLIDVLTMRLEECLAWESLVTKHVPPEDQPQRYHDLAKILEEIGTLAEEALNFPVAIQAFEQGLKLNQRSTIQAGFSSSLKSYLEKAKLAETRYADYSLALEELEQNPGSPDANLKVGTFLAFHQNSWPEALPYLSRGSDPLLRQMAKEEQETPEESSAMVSLGNLWRDYAENNALPADQASAYHRTIFWYQQAISNSNNSLEKLSIEKKLDALPQFEVAVPEKGLIFFFPFDGSIQDASPHQHPTRPIRESKYVVGPVNQAILLDGRSNITVGYHFSFQVDNEFTVSALVILNPKLPTTRSWPQILGHRITSYRSALDLGTTRPAQGETLRWRASISNGATNQNEEIGQEIQSTAIVKPGIWTHLVYTVNRNACEFWIDGKLDQRVIRTPETIDNIGRSSRDFTIGSNGYYGSDLNWVGAIDNVRFYDRSLKAREIKSLYQVDAGVAVAVSVNQNSDDDSATELATDNVSLKFDNPITRYRVALPDGVSQDNLSLRITDLIGFQNTRIITPGATAVAGKDVIIELTDDPSRVRFKVKIDLVNNEAFILLRSIFKLVTTSPRDTALTIDQLKKSIQAIAQSISQGIREREYWADLLPNIESEVLSLRRRAESGDTNAVVPYGVALTKYKRASGRIKSLNKSLPKSIRQLERLKGLQDTLNQLQGTAKIYFALVPSSAGN
jgi:tetratricopeptide (TPR) repeat protein